jgi:hypothetical protein
LTLAEAGAIAGVIGEELYPEREIGRAFEPPHYGCAASRAVRGNDYREVLAVVSARVAVTSVVGCRPIGVKVDSQARVGKNGIRRDGVARARKDDHPITPVKGYGIARAAGCAAYSVSADEIDEDAVQPVP